MIHFALLIVEWSGEVRSITYSADGKSVSVVYRVTLYGTDAEVIFFMLNFRACACYINLFGFEHCPGAEITENTH